MANLDAQQKLDLITEKSLADFQAGKTKEEIAEKLILAGITSEGIGFAEVLNLVTRAGKNGGFIKTPEQRKADLKAELADIDLSVYNDYDKFTEFVDTMYKKHGNAIKWTTDAVKAAFAAKGISVPKKSTLTPWQSATIEAFNSNPELTQVELDDVIKDVGVQNFQHYSNLVWGLCNGIVTHWESEVKSIQETLAEAEAKLDQLEANLKKRGKK